MLAICDSGCSGGPLMSGRVRAALGVYYSTRTDLIVTESAIGPFWFR